MTAAEEILTQRAPGSSDLRASSIVFAVLLVLATILPRVVVPLIDEVSASRAQTSMILVGLLAISGAHQPASWFLYADRESRSIVLGHPRFFFLGPLAIIALCGAFFVYAPLYWHPYFWFAWGVVSIHHYQKQNLGVFSLLTNVLGGGRMLPIERSLILVGGFCGMATFGFPIGRTLLDGTLFKSLESWLSHGAMAGLGVLSVICLGLLWSPPPGDPAMAEPKGAEPRHPLRWLLLLTLVTYYWPLFFIEDKLMAFAMIGPGHGLQYWVIMGYVAAEKGGGAPAEDARWGTAKSRLAYGRLFAFAAGTALLAWSFQSAREVWGVDASRGAPSPLQQLVTAVVLSVTLIHYWVDARMWKMSQPDSRRFMRSKLRFLFPLVR